MVPFECWNDNCYCTRIRPKVSARPNLNARMITVGDSTELCFSEAVMMMGGC
ncbi:hypothetical protein HanRHA438_Chr17g0797491 [Helianthus annuus]|nr:hypothetical protein HanRHA438_Chr17g0797491 [Helianthus annuus]